MLNVAVLAEFSIQLEMVRFAQLTGDIRFAELGYNIIQKVSQSETSLPGLYSVVWKTDTFTPNPSKMFLGCFIHYH